MVQVVSFQCGSWVEFGKWVVHFDFKWVVGSSVIQVMANAGNNYTQNLSLCRRNCSLCKRGDRSIPDGRFALLAWSKVARTTLLLWTEMSILRDDKMRPLFKEAIVTKLAVTQSTTRYQMKATDIMFTMMPHDSLWVTWFRHPSPAKLGIFPK